MNKCALLLVFISGIVFSVIVSILRSWIDLDLELFITSPFKDVGIGILPPNADLKLMDDGYIAMARLGSHSDQRKEKKSLNTELEERSSELEALNTLKAAVELVSAGKQARAERLLAHAHSLAPRHHDVLLTFGEYLEEYKEDLFQADHMFLKALAISPTSSRALRNRRRTQPLVDKLDSSLLLRIDNKRDELLLIPMLSSALRRVKREAYFHHIYHTAAIEGNTLTLAQIRMILETGLSIGGKSVTEHNEILGLDLALRYINTTLVHRVGQISLSDILEIHRRVLGHVDPIEAGTLRTTQVFVSNHIPPAPSKIHPLMEDFVQWMNSHEAQSLHPIKYAALAHYKLVFIHPFVDGNGRTARLLMNFLLMQAGFPPVIIRKQDRVHYYNHLQTANDGDTRPFVRFIAHCTEKTIDVYLWATKDHLPELEQERSSIENGNMPMVRPDAAVEEANQGTTPILSHRLYLDAEDRSTFTSHDTSWTSNIDEEENDQIDSHLWLTESEEKPFDTKRILDETEIYESVLNIDRLKDFASVANGGAKRTSPGT